MSWGIGWPLWAAVALLADVLVCPNLAIGGIRPDAAVSVMMILWIRKRAESERLIGAWAVGLGRDLLSAGPPGLHALSFLLLAWAAEYVRRSWFVNHLLLRSLLIAAAVALETVVAATLAWLAGLQVSPGYAALYGAGAGLASGLLFGVFPEIFIGVVWRLRSVYSRLAWS